MRPRLTLAACPRLHPSRATASLELLGHNRQVGATRGAAPSQKGSFFDRADDSSRCHSTQEDAGAFPLLSCTCRKSHLLPACKMRGSLGTPGQPDSQQAGCLSALTTHPPACPPLVPGASCCLAETPATQAGGQGQGLPDGKGHATGRLWSARRGPRPSGRPRPDSRSSSRLQNYSQHSREARELSSSRAGDRRDSSPEPEP